MPERIDFIPSDVTDGFLTKVLSLIVGLVIFVDLPFLKDIVGLKQLSYANLK